MNNSYLYVDPNLQSVGVFEDAQLADFTERHHFRLPTLPLSISRSLDSEIATRPVEGVVFALTTGLPGRRHLQVARYALGQNRAVFFYWPAESAVEVIDDERLESLRRHRLAFLATKAFARISDRLPRLQARRISSSTGHAPPSAGALVPLRDGLKFAVEDIGGTRNALVSGITQSRLLKDLAVQLERELKEVRDRLDNGASSDELRGGLEQLATQAETLARAFEGLQALMDGGEIALDRGVKIVSDLLAMSEAVPVGESAPDAPAVAAPDSTAGVIAEYGATLSAFRERAAPIRFSGQSAAPTPERPWAGTGVYVRTDYWAQLISGGSYGHTCYVAKELARRTERFTCLMSSHYALLDDLGLAQEVVRPPLVTATEVDWMKADRFYYDALRSRLEALRPAYIYERLCMGNFAAARLSRDLGIPYVVEYNGSEIAMRRSFGSGAFEHQDQFLEAERLAFEQATMITVISDHVRDDVLRRGIDPAKVLVNPNGVDPEEYSPASPAEKTEIRSELGLPADVQVVAFIGTFGGWHGIDVLAASLPEICRAAPDVRFLLIGDGHLKPLVLDATREHRLEDRVVDMGRTEQRTGARLLKAADIFVSPHSSHMRDSPFFGSPTKLFEYMALGGGIVASDLEQLGVVMSPALRPSDFERGSITVTNERGVLCAPGDVQEFVAGVLGLVRRPDLAKALGENARRAVLDEYTWSRHVAKVWDHMVGMKPEPATRDASRNVGTGG